MPASSSALRQPSMRSSATSNSAGPLMQACDQIAREIRSSYTVGFEPPERDGHYHRVVVKVDGADRGTLTTRTRPGYVASASAEPRR